MLSTLLPLAIVFYLQKYCTKKCELPLSFVFTSSWLQVKKMIVYAVEHALQVLKEPCSSPEPEAASHCLRDSKGDDESCALENVQ